MYFLVEEETRNILVQDKSVGHLDFKLATFVETKEVPGRSLDY